MRKFTLIMFILLSGACSKKIMISNSDLETKFKIASEKQRIEQRDRKVLLLLIWAVGGFGLSYLAYNNYPK